MKKDPIIVNPHHKDGDKKEHTDIAQTGLFNSCISVVNSERSAIWQRYSTMLIANSIIIGFLVKHEFGQSLFVLAGSVLGIFLCVLWWLITEDGWRFFKLYSEIAGRFQWPNIDKDINVNKVMFEEFDRLASEGRFRIINRFNKGDRIKTLAFSVILLFFVFYIFFAVIAINRLIP